MLSEDLNPCFEIRYRLRVSGKSFYLKINQEFIGQPEKTGGKEFSNEKRASQNRNKLQEEDMAEIECGILCLMIGISRRGLWGLIHTCVHLLSLVYQLLTNSSEGAVCYTWW